MTFELKLSQSGLVIGPDGDFVKVENRDKLYQDVIKLILTPLKGNKFFPWYGSAVESVLGNIIDQNFTSTMASSQISSALETLKKIQLEQGKTQFLSLQEQLAAVKSISVHQNTVDPRYYQINVEIINKFGEKIQASVNL